uniref:hypothetical protein n=1 Tax=Burkholderia diffusa TaxID=488732 RepID=UPI001CC44546|nr:hypothetical protein [Burkholderia diffusa]
MTTFDPDRSFIMGIATTMSRALSFSHLGARSARAADDDDKPAERDREDDTAKRGKARRAQDDEHDDDRDDKPDAKAADDAPDDDKPDAEDDDKPDDDDDSGKGKRSRRARRARAQDDEDDAEDDDDESEMRGSSATARARRREQARCAAIFNTRAAARNPQLAAQLAFTTRLPRDEAIALLEAAPTPPAAPDRAARNPRVGPGGSPEALSRQAIAAGWDRAFEQVNPRRPH